MPFSRERCAKRWVISFNSIRFWFWVCDEVLYLELLSNLFFVICKKKTKDDSKWNHSISAAKCNESWKSELPLTSDPNSSAASNQTFNHFEMIVSCRRRTLLCFLFFYDQMSSTFTGQLLHQLHSEVAFLHQGRFWKRNICGNDANVWVFMAFAEVNMHLITHH